MVSTGYKFTDEDVLADIELTRRIQVFGAWCGPAFVLLLFGCWGLMAGFIPMIPPDAAPGEVADRYADNQALLLVGLILGMVGVFLTQPYFFVVSMQMRRSAPGVPALAIVQFGAGIVTTVVLLIPMLIFIVGWFRPERSPELTQMLNDMSYIMLILPWPPILGQNIPLAISVFSDRRRRPVFPRWVAYVNLWIAVLVTPASLLIFFKVGPFAWNGLLGFWIPAAVFASWYIAMTYALLRAVRDEAEEARRAVMADGDAAGGAAARKGEAVV